MALTHAKHLDVINVAPLGEGLHGTVSTSLIKTGMVSTRGGKASWTFSVDGDEWGTYYIKLVDSQGGHATGTTFYMDAPG